jgi:hypothetical protein
MALDGVLDRERVQPELLGQDGQVRPGFRRSQAHEGLIDGV